jgi:hypothetical protein
VAVDALVAAWPFEVLPRRWVHVLAYGCSLARDEPVVTSPEHLDVRFVAAGELGSLSLAPGYRAAIDRWRDAVPNPPGGPRRGNL